jgi:hypothetical protein
MSKQEELEERIREQRTVEANRKGLVGHGGKIGVVLRVFGQPIVDQSEGGIYVDTNRLEEWDKDESEPRNALEMMRKIPIMDMGGHDRPSTDEWSELNDPIPYGTRTVGWHFDGLGRGMHLEIKYDEATTELALTYKGYQVYKEVKGELNAYIPHPEWEGWIDQLFKKARDIQRVMKEQEFEAQMKASEKNKEKWLREIALRWGIIK